MELSIAFILIGIFVLFVVAFIVGAFIQNKKGDSCKAAQHNITITFKSKKT